MKGYPFLEPSFLPHVTAQLLELLVIKAAAFAPFVTPLPVFYSFFLPYRLGFRARQFFASSEQPAAAAL
jgi:hypothetical protein